MRGKPLPTQIYLRKLFKYDPITGEFNTCDRASISTNSQGYKTITIHKRFRDYSQSPDKNAHGICRSNWKFPLHRVIWKYMKGYDPYIIDHINRDRADNRWANLRNATEDSNFANSRINRKNKTKYKNVYYCPVLNKWEYKSQMFNCSTRAYIESLR